MNENKNLKKGLGTAGRIYTTAKHTSAGKLEQSGTRNTSGMAGYDKQSDRIGTVSSVMYLFFNHDSLCDPCI